MQTLYDMLFMASVRNEVFIEISLVSCRCLYCSILLGKQARAQQHLA